MYVANSPGNDEYCLEIQAACEVLYDGELDGDGRPMIVPVVAFGGFEALTDCDKTILGEDNNRKTVRTFCEECLFCGHGPGRCLCGK